MARGSIDKDKAPRSADPLPVPCESLSHSFNVGIFQPIFEALNGSPKVAVN